MAKKEKPSVEELRKQLKEAEAEERAEKKKKKVVKKKRIDFSKLIIIAVFVLCSRWIELTYRLAMADKEQIAEQLAIVIVTTILGSIIAYGCKSAFEKNSRNKYGVAEVEEIKGNKEEIEEV